MFSQCPRVVPEFWKGGLGESCTILSVSLSLKREKRERGGVVRAFICRPIEVWAGAEHLSLLLEREY